MVKFKIIENDSYTNARLGILNLNGKKIKTPVLWLVCSIKDKPRPWEYFNVKTIMVNAYEIFVKKITINSIHKFLNTNGLIMMDSGGFQLMKKNISITPSEILKIYKQTEPDVGVVLDFPLDPSNMDNRLDRWKKTLKNTKFMLDNSHDIVLMPVIHGYTLKEIKKACHEIKKITDPKFVGIGSLVPIIRNMKTSNISKLNGINTIEFMIKKILTVRKEFPDAFLHVFGIGSVATMHLMFSLGADSVDSLSWRMKAGFGAIQLPGIGDRFISPNNGRKRLEEDYLLKKCECPICIGKSLNDRKKALDNSKHGTFYNRAIHNAYTFKEEEHEFHKALCDGNLMNFLEKRLGGSKYYNLIKSS